MTELVTLAEKHEYQQLFIRELHWSAPDHPPITLAREDGPTVTATNVSSYRGIRVWVCDERPGSNLEAALDRLIAKNSTDRLVIFYDDDQQVWRWPVRRNRDNATTSRLTSHRHRSGNPNPKFAARLSAIELPLDHTLDATGVLAKVRAAFDVETQNETRYASTLMARMYTAMEKAYPKSFSSKTRDHEISVSLARILFLMFGDDTDMWVVDAFRSYIHEQTASDGTDIGRQLNRLFDHLDTASPSAPHPGLSVFPYVNGGIFNERMRLPDLNNEFRDAVLDACAVDWSTISPAIFGSMFQSVRDAQTRRELGEHYTSEENILKTLNPLFLDELRTEFERARTMKDERRVLIRLWARLGEIRFMDPACGCGNFIIISYRELRDLELEIMERLQEISGDAQLAFDPTLSLKVTLDHFAGIEIDEWPARIAETAMFLIDRQCDLKLKERFGDAPQRLPIHTQSRIVSGISALQYDWTQIFAPNNSVVIAGNPPYAGQYTKSDEQIADLILVCGDDYNGYLDYVTGWFFKSAEYIGDRNIRVAFVATSSICQGEPVAALWAPLLAAGLHIDFAYQPFVWESEARGKAGVHVVIVGMSKDVLRERWLYSNDGRGVEQKHSVKNISPYLLSGPDIIVTPRSTPLLPSAPRVTKGSAPVDAGFLLVSEDELPAIEADPIAMKYLRRFVGAKELIHGLNRWCLWLKDADLQELQGSAEIRRRLESVAAFRTASKKGPTRNLATTPYLFGEDRQPVVSYLCIPRHVSENRRYFPVVRLEPDVVSGDHNFVAKDPDGVLFALLSSSTFIIWMRAVAGRLRADLRFSNTLVWNTFPFPELDNESKAKLSEGGELILAAREANSDASLADLYDQPSIPTALLKAHQALDQIVDAVFAPRRRLHADTDRLALLFARYQELVAPISTLFDPAVASAGNKRTRHSTDVSGQ